MVGLVYFEFFMGWFGWFRVYLGLVDGLFSVIWVG